LTDTSENLCRADLLGEWRGYRRDADVFKNLPDAASRILGGAMPDVAAGYLSLAQALEAGAQFPELILVYNPQEDELVMLEGHVRVTAYLVYLLLSKDTKLDLPVLVGCSDRLKK